ncbi:MULTISPECIES: restriction endonuclease [Streptomyces]|uniref:Restriction endonuclease type IV Mrr domain-containing protein n=1 Tax=Streptomyces mordarskii TaxID=1226758 RepID=A0ABN1DXU5_9ACTN
MATAIRRTRSRARRRRFTTRLRRLHWGWKATGLLLTIAAIRTWTAQILTALAVTAALGLTAGAVYGRQYLQNRPHRSRPARRVRWIPRPRAAQPTDLAGYLALDPTAFEQAIADLALRDPEVYSAVRQGGANDRAADVLVSLRDGRRIVIQCKRYQPRKAVDADTVYSLNGTYAAWHHANAATIVTTSRFTQSARAFADGVGIRLVDGPGLARWTHGGTPPWA